MSNTNRILASAQQQTVNSFADHVAHKMALYAKALDYAHMDSVVIASGGEMVPFRDDNHNVFKCNPYFKEWLPLPDSPYCYLHIEQGKKPILYVYTPQDFWHSKPQALPSGYDLYFQIETYADRVNIQASNKTAYIGEVDYCPSGLLDAPVNPENLLQYVDYNRAKKTGYEQQCIRTANQVAIQGHLAARDVFEKGGSEFEIHMAYLLAMDCREQELPYSNIVALNENAAILHHNQIAKAKPENHHTLLIDAGYSHFGFCSDITRTYLHKDAQGSALAEYQTLLQRLDQVQQDLVQQVKPGVNYTDIHISAHRQIAEFLCEVGVITCSAEQAVEQGLCSAFYPHGVGHLIGSQVHDRAGHMQNVDGDMQPPSKEHPFLRCTRIIEEEMVLTIEPGFYFVPILLEPFSDSKDLNHALISQLLSFGGARIEDNVVAKKQGVENYTRDAFSTV